MTRALFVSVVLAAVACGSDPTSESAATASMIAPGSSPTNLSMSAAPTPSAATTSSAGPADGLPPGRAACEVEYDPQALPDADTESKTLADQREAMIGRMKVMLNLDDAVAQKIRDIFGRSKMAGQGNPETTKHPMSRSECVEKRRTQGIRDERERLCASPFMVPIFDATARKEDAAVCIDRYEFPGLPCEYPATWVTASAAAELCGTLGKRLCDAHEWEGACAGDLRPIGEEYDFTLNRDSMSAVQNGKRKITWAYGEKKDHAKCGTNSTKSKECTASGWKCGSNTYPAGAFPECKSAFGVYDQHGNAAEHMLLPLRKADLGSSGGKGVAEMKGSWFIFQKHEAHKDDCRWRANSWHDDEGLNHANYHLGFRCCKDIRPLKSP